MLCGCIPVIFDYDTGERTEPALKRFERVLVGGALCELSPPACDVATTKQCPTMFAANLSDGKRYRPGW